ncbi:N-acetylglucosamine kinase [Kitasatospora camelliae]|uniref:BadF/BadG/BcrA/BcrD ATPase family protein n=1 Tax=Kitasatospora camelliae TaxID=3156397 RepID=A0AAU8JWJ4_9ACTN
MTGRAAPDPSGALVLGIDVGGSTTRVLVAGLDGRVIGTGRAGGGNPVAHGGPAAAAEVAAALRAALTGVDPGAVVAGVVGLAGGTVASRVLAGVWPAAGLRVLPRLVSDVELAYAAGTDRPDGTVLVAGTGAVAGECRDFTPVRFADGHGWLLGDRGSGYWLGRTAVSSALTTLDRTRAPGALPPFAAAVVAALTGATPPTGGPDAVARLRAAVIGAAHAEPPVRLARLAPLVLRGAAEGDPDARQLVERAADHLLTTLGTVRAPDSTRPVVLAGGVLVPASPLTEAVRTRITARWPAASVPLAAGTAGAAAWLAARPLGVPGTLHRRLVGAPD